MGVLEGCELRAARCGAAKKGGIAMASRRVSQTIGGRRLSLLTEPSARKVADPGYELFKNLWRQERLLPPFDNQVHGSNVRLWSYCLMVLVVYLQQI